jgi:hypothetical protein
LEQRLVAARADVGGPGLPNAEGEVERGNQLGANSSVT